MLLHQFGALHTMLLVVVSLEKVNLLLLPFPKHPVDFYPSASFSFLLLLSRFCFSSPSYWLLDGFRWLAFIGWLLLAGFWKRLADMVSFVAMVTRIL